MSYSLRTNIGIRQFFSLLIRNSSTDHFVRLSIDPSTNPSQMPIWCLFCNLQSHQYRKLFHVSFIFFVCDTFVEDYWCTRWGFLDCSCFAAFSSLVLPFHIFSLSMMTSSWSRPCTLHKCKVHMSSFSRFTSIIYQTSLLPFRTVVNENFSWFLSLCLVHCANHHCICIMVYSTIVLC